MIPSGVPVVIIGAGHAGLAMSLRLTERSIDHVVLERGTVANSWRMQRWDSLRLLTPNFHNRLPGAAPAGEDPNGFLTATQTADMIRRYATDIAAPVVTDVNVVAVQRLAGVQRRYGYEVVTDQGSVRCACVVVATGGNARPTVPAGVDQLPDSIASLTALNYRNPTQLADGAVLVVGASATGVQLADEIHSSGRPVMLSVGEHVRMPRTYRGRDAFSWLEEAGVLGERFDEIDDLARVRNLPSPQLIGTPERRSVDLNSLQQAGVHIVGRLGRMHDGVAQFSGGLANTCKLADLKLARLLDRFDAIAQDDAPPPERFEPIRLPASATTELDLVAAGVRTVVWATGLQPDHHFVDLPVFDHTGRIRHDGGLITAAPGAYVLGLGALRRRRSSYIAGADHDTAELADHLHRHLDAIASSPHTG